MLEQTLCLEKLHKNRIDEVARRSPESVVLVARNTSGKTLTLFVTVPGLYPVQKAVVKLHRRLHKTFWQIVKAAQEWLRNWKELFAPKPKTEPVLLLPASIPDPAPVKSDRERLLAAAANLPVKAEQPMVAAYDWKARKEQSDAISEKKYNNRWDAAAAKPGQLGGNPRRKAGLA